MPRKLLLNKQKQNKTKQKKLRIIWRYYKADTIKIERA